MTISSLAHAAIVFLAMVYAVNWPLRLVIRAPWARLASAIAISLIFVFLPLPWLDTLYLFLAGFFWPVSAALAIGLPYRLLAGAGGPLRGREADYLVWCGFVVLCGVLVLPGSLFPALPELYDLGYAGPFVPALMGGMLLVAIVARSWLVTAWLGLASLWSLAGINPGTNLWDSLVDPLAFIGSAIILVGAGISRLRRWRPSAGRAREQSGG